MEQKVTSKKFSLDWRDVLKGVLVAMLTAFIATGGQMLEQWLTTPDFAFDRVNLILSLKAAIGAGVAYLVKNFLTPQQVVSTIKVIVLLVCIGFISSCRFTTVLAQHNAIQVTRQPTTPEDTISVVWRFWGAKDLVTEFIPANNRFGNFVKQSTKHCHIEFLQLPQDLNDTVAVELTCDSSLSTFKGWLPNKNAH